MCYTCNNFETHLKELFYEMRWTNKIKKVHIDQCRFNSITARLDIFPEPDNFLTDYNVVPGIEQYRRKECFWTASRISELIGHLQDCFGYVIYHFKLSTEEQNICVVFTHVSKI